MLFDIIHEILEDGLALAFRVELQLDNRVSLALLDHNEPTRDLLRGVLDLENLIVDEALDFINEDIEHDSLVMVDGDEPQGDFVVSRVAWVDSEVVEVVENREENLGSVLIGNFLVKSLLRGKD